MLLVVVLIRVVCVFRVCERMRLLVCVLASSCFDVIHV